MEDNNQLSSTNSPAEIPQLTPESISFLLKAAKWGKFLAILGFIVTGLLVVAAILMSFVMNFVSDEMVPMNLPFSPKIFSIFYILLAGIYVVPVIFLNSFSNNAIKAANLSSTELLTASIKNLKNLFVFIGVSTIVILSFYVIMLIIVGTAAIASL
ncbi:MAG: hypothetical protein WCR72_00770 [Bacteroidota bacterium]